MPPCYKRSLVSKRCTICTSKTESMNSANSAPHNADRGKLWACRRPPATEEAFADYQAQIRPQQVYFSGETERAPAEEDASLSAHVIRHWCLRKFGDTVAAAPAFRIAQEVRRRTPRAKIHHHRARGSQFTASRSPASRWQHNYIQTVSCV